METGREPLTDQCAKEYLMNRVYSRVCQHKKSIMVKYGSSLAFCTTAVERELYKFMCTTKRECGSIRMKAEWLFIIPVTDWESVFHQNLHSNPSFVEFWDEI